MGWMFILSDMILEIKRFTLAFEMFWFSDSTYFDRSSLKEVDIFLPHIVNYSTADTIASVRFISFITQAWKKAYKSRDMYRGSNWQLANYMGTNFQRFTIIKIKRIGFTDSLMRTSLLENKLFVSRFEQISQMRYTNLIP